MIAWKFNIERQLESYLSCLKSVNSGFYQHHRFYLLPSLPEKFRDRVAFLPKSSYLKRHKSSKKSKVILKPLNSEKEEIVKLANYVYQKRKVNLKNLELNFSETVNVIKPKLEKIFPIAKNLNIVISPSLFGSVGAYQFTNSTIMVSPRFDRQIQDVYMLTVHALTHFLHFDPQNLNIKSNLWTEKQQLTNKHFNELNSDGLFPCPKGMLYFLKNNHCGNLAEQSANYFNWLNQPLKNKINASEIAKKLTKNELAVFNLLGERKNQVVGLDEIAEVIWREKTDEKYSLYAIAKTIERLRRKIKESGANNNLIHSQRGSGYVLYN